MGNFFAVVCGICGIAIVLYAVLLLTSAIAGKAALLIAGLLLIAGALAAVYLGYQNVMRRMDGIIQRLDALLGQGEDTQD